MIRVEARLKAIRSSPAALEATETGYEVGTRNIVDVLQAHQRLNGSQFDYADSRYTYLLNLMRLKQSAGTLSEADLKELNSYMSPTTPVQREISASKIHSHSTGLIVQKGWPLALQGCRFLHLPIL